MKKGGDLKMEKSARPRTALNECVKVVVRCRPLSAREISEGNEEVSSCAARTARAAWKDALRCLRGCRSGQHRQQKISIDNVLVR